MQNSLKYSFSINEYIFRTESDLKLKLKRNSYIQVDTFQLNVKKDFLGFKKYGISDSKFYVDPFDYEMTNIRKAKDSSSNNPSQFMINPSDIEFIEV